MAGAIDSTNPERKAHKDSKGDSGEWVIISGRMVCDGKRLQERTTATATCPHGNKNLTHQVQ
jgi:hypothetical protein